MDEPTPVITLIVPTRNRPDQLRTFLQSIARTAHQPLQVEVVLVIDADDTLSPKVSRPDLVIRRVIVPPGLTMGALNQSGYEASTGRYLMLLNDDVIARTSHWDWYFRESFRQVPDEILLLHVNDLVFQQRLCTFPVVSRKFCERAGGICPREYRRYRIDDHIEDIFNLLGTLGEKRSVYLPDIIFEHANYTTNEGGERQYFSDPTILGQDGPLFEAFFESRKKLALRLFSEMNPRAFSNQESAYRNRLESVENSLALRVPERLRVRSESDFYSGTPGRWWHWLTEKSKRAQHCMELAGWRGFGRIVWNKLRKSRAGKDYV